MPRYTVTEVLIQHTKDVIDQEGEMIALSRNAFVADGAGGFKEGSETPVVLPAVKRFVGAVAINVRSGNTRQYFQDESGERYQVKYVMLGMPGDDIQEGDFFTYRGELMKVADIHPDQTFEVRAQIIGWSNG